MTQLPPIVPVREIPETFENYMSPIEWLAKLTKAYNDIAASVWDMSYDETSRTLTIREREVENDG